MDGGLHDEVKDLLLQHRPVALAVGRVVDGKREVYWAGSESRTRRSRAVDDSTLFRVASISKVVTTLLLLRLSQRGVVEMEAPANDYLSSFRLVGAGRDATVRELLTHTSGLGLIRDVRDLRMSRSFGPPAHRRGIIDPSRFYQPTLEISGRAGAVWSYGNHGHSVAGQLAADVTGIPFGDLIRDEVLAPLGMSRSGFAISSGLALGYNQAPWYGYRRVRRRSFVAAPAGEFVTNLRDMMVLAEALAINEGGFLDADNHAALFKPQRLRSGEEIPFAGLGFRLRHLGSQLVAVHGGRYCGYSSFLIIDFENQAAAVALSTGIKLPAARSIAERVMTGAPCARREVGGVPGPTTLPTPGIYRLRPAGFIPNVHGLVATGGVIRVSVKDGSFSWVSPIGAFASGASAVQFGMFPGRYRYVKRRGRPQEAQVATDASGRSVIWMLPALLIFDHAAGSASGFVEAVLALNRLRAWLRGAFFETRPSHPDASEDGRLGIASSAILGPHDA